MPSASFQPQPPSPIFHPTTPSSKRRGGHLGRASCFFCPGSPVSFTLPPTSQNSRTGRGIRPGKGQPVRLQRAQGAARMLNRPQWPGCGSQLKSLRRVSPSLSFCPPSPARLCPAQPRCSPAPRRSSGILCSPLYEELWPAPGSRWERDVNEGAWPCTASQ